MLGNNYAIMILGLYCIYKVSDTQDNKIKSMEKRMGYTKTERKVQRRY